MSKKLVASRGMSSNLYLNKPVGGGSKKSGLAPSFLGGAGVSMVRGRSYMGGPKGEQANYKNKDLVFHYKSTIGGIGHNVGGRSLYRMMDGVNNYSLSSTNINKDRKKIVAYLANWEALPEGVTAEAFYTPLFRYSTHVIVAFVKNYSGTVDKTGDCSPSNTCYSGDGTKCLYFDPPKAFKTHTEFISFAKKINPDIKLLISLGGETMGCCPNSKEQYAASGRDFFSKFINSNMLPGLRQQIIKNLYNLIIDPDNTLFNTKSANNCRDSWPPQPTPKPNLESTSEKIVGIMGATSNNLGTYEPIPVKNFKSYDGIDIDYEYSWDIDDTKHPIALITNGLRRIPGFQSKKLVLSHAPFNALFNNTDKEYYTTLKKFIRTGLVDFLNLQYYSNPPWAIDICTPNPKSNIQTNYKNALDVVNNDSSKLVFLLATTGNCTRSSGNGGAWTIAGSHTNPKITLSQLYCNIHTDINSLPNLGYWYADSSSSIEMSRALAETMTKGCRLLNKCPSTRTNCITPAPAPNKKQSYIVKQTDSDGCSAMAGRLCHGANYLNVICDAITVCANLQVNETIYFNCAGNKGSNCNGVTPTPPTPAPAPTPPPPTKGSYSVVSGDTCSKIAMRFCSGDGTNYSKVICDASTVCTNLQVGAKIKYNCAGNTGGKCNF